VEGVEGRKYSAFFLQEREKAHLARQQYVNMPLSKKNKKVISQSQVHTTGGDDKYIRIQKKRGSIQIGVNSVDV